jgi:DNA polymerase-1
MKVIIDIEANGLFNPTRVWLIVCKDIDTGEYHVFRNPSTDPEARSRFFAFAAGVDQFIGHNVLDYDYPVLSDLLGYVVDDPASVFLDTLIVSKLVDYPRQGHSIEDYGLEFGLPKIDFTDFTQWSQELETYCIRDCDINHRIYLKYRRYIQGPGARSVALEHQFQIIVNKLHTNGFAFNTEKAKKLLEKVEAKLKELDDEILTEFPRRPKFVKEVTPRLTQHGTLNRNDFRFERGIDLSCYNGGPFSLLQWVDFNPSSHKQVIDVLWQAGWEPVDKTATHIDTLRELKSRDCQFKEFLELKLKGLQTYGWKINETNLGTLPPSAPKPARLLAQRILYESRRRTLVEWLGLVSDAGRIHGQFRGIGAWTHRMAHQNPNTANIPNDTDLSGKPKLLGGEMRSLWIAPKNRLLVGVDAEGIQLRIFAHYIDDPEFTAALVSGKKEDKSDPHSLNQRVLGSVCKSRAAAKRFIFALLLGAGLGKLGEILVCSEDEAKSALARIMERYEGFNRLKTNTIPADAKRGWFVGLDGRRVVIPGATPSERRHLCMSGYLQNGEAVVMKKATVLSEQLLEDAEIDHLLVDLVHDEWQDETPNNVEIALQVAKMRADCLRLVGEQLGLRCPLAGSYWNEDKKDYTIGTNWRVTH